MKSFLDVFIGSTQSKLAGVALLVAVLVVSIAILFSRETIPLGQKFLIVLLLLLISAPGVLLTLLEMTCVITGTRRGNNWWCNAYAWYMAIVILISSILVVVSAIMAMSEQRDVERFVDQKESLNKANAVAADFFADRAPAAGSNAPPVGDQAELPKLGLIAGSETFTPLPAFDPERERKAAELADTPVEKFFAPTNANEEKRNEPVPSAPEHFTSSVAAF